jgi:hypothetical protein
LNNYLKDLEKSKHFPEEFNLFEPSKLQAQRKVKTSSIAPGKIGACHSGQ